MRGNTYLFIMALVIGGLLLPGSAPADQHNVIVPNVEGIPQAVAIQILRTTGLHPSLQRSSGTSTLVVSQDPRPGMLLPMGSEVRLMTGLRSPQQERSLVTPEQTVQVSRPARAIEMKTVPAPASGQTQDLRVSVTPRVWPQYQQKMIQSSSSVQVVQPPAVYTTQSLPQTTEARYPIWYPKEFIPQTQSAVLGGSTSRMVSQTPYSPYMQVAPHSLAEEILGSPATVTVSVQGVPSSYAPTPAVLRVDEDNRPYQSSVFVQRTVSASAAQVVSVPHVTRLRREDALRALQKAGLAIERLVLVQDPQWRSGLVMQQSPRARTIVPAGTRVELWITN